MTNLPQVIEEWKPVPGFENLFASDLGRIRRGNVIRKQTLTKKKYMYVSCGVGKRIFAHRLIGFAWVPNPENKPYINHKNGVKWDNRPVNLEWSTTKENTTHAWYDLDRDNHKPKKPVLIYKNGELIAETLSVSLAAKYVKGYSSAVSKVCQGRSANHRGYIFRYKEAV